MNLAGIVVPGTRVPAVPGRFLRFRNGSVIDEQPAASPRATQDLLPPEPVAQTPELRLF
jgi:hypothetical protein